MKANDIRGYGDEVMDDAIAAGATGGTIIHSKGTGSKHNEKFHGVTLADEKEMIYIIAQSSIKSNIMKTINQNCGIDTSIGAICFSLPVSEVVGIRQFTSEES